MPPKAQKILPKLKTVIKGHNFILGGGTALAMQIGHRISVDLDFFTETEFSTDLVLRKIKQLGFTTQILQEEKGTLTVVIDGVKVSFFHYPYPFVDKSISSKGIPIAGILDIASMKIIAISQRGAKRDFVDLYFILQDVPFWKIAENLIGRFGADRINPLNIGKSLVYFNDADIDPEPQYLVKPIPKWDLIKKFFARNVQQMVIDIQRAKVPT
jgi:hypothetical protein